MSLKDYLIKELEKRKQEFDKACKELEIAFTDKKPRDGRDNVERDLLVKYKPREYNRYIDAEGKLSEILKFAERCNIGIDSQLYRIPNYMISIRGAA